jgi:hypothetical protein
MEKNLNHMIARRIIIGSSIFTGISLITLKSLSLINMHWVFVVTSFWWAPILLVFTITMLYFMAIGIAFFFAFFFKRGEKYDRHK